MATTETTSVVRPGPQLDELVGRAVTAIDGLELAGRRLAVMGENRPETLIAHLAALSAGVSSVPVPRYLGGDEIGHILRDSDSGAVLSGSARAGIAAGAAADAGLRNLRLEDWLADRPSLSIPEYPELIYSLIDDYRLPVRAIFLYKTKIY